MLNTSYRYNLCPGFRTLTYDIALAYDAINYCVLQREHFSLDDVKKALEILISHEIAVTKSVAANLSYDTNSDNAYYNDQFSLTSWFRNIYLQFVVEGK